MNQLKIEQLKKEESSHSLPSSNSNYNPLSQAQNHMGGTVSTHRSVAMSPTYSSPDTWKLKIRINSHSNMIAAETEQDFT